MLYIYKASAGSGKTHLLTGFFLQLLFKKPVEVDDGKRPLLFNEILAVTFTNKATAEMKERIIKELHTLYTQPEESDFIEALMESEGGEKALTIEQIRRRAFAILNAILNDYSELHVSTIDSFFQQVLRSFAHELNLQGNFEIELDADAILDQVVSQFITGLSPKSDKETFDWMVEFASNRLDDGSGWNVHSELLKLAKVLTSESYKQNSLRIAQFTQDRKELRTYIEYMRKIQREWKQSLIETGKQGEALLEECGLQPADFKGGPGRSPMLCFGRWAKGDSKDPSATLLKCKDDTNEWYTKTFDPNRKLGGTNEMRLQELIGRGIDLLTGDPRTRYESAKAIARNIYQLGLLSRLEQEANRYCEEKGIQLLSNTTQILSRLIDEEEAPFIYEKAGTKIQSYMIDEFQDTSTMQWNNFKPLLNNSLSTENSNLIVGDVKQSIYRWRGSDWELLNSTIYGFNKKQQHFNEDNNQLFFNFRSDRKIIDFNNKFFKFAAERLAMSTDDDSMQKIVDIYADVEQRIHEKREASIGEGLLYYEEVAEDEATSAEDKIIERLPEMVIALQQKGFKPKDILILGRYNRECKKFAEALLNFQKEHPDCKYRMDIITDEALSLSNRGVIRTLIAMMHAILEPKSELRRMVANCCYLKLAGKSTSEAICIHANTGKNGTSLLPDLQPFSNLPLFEMVEGLISILPQGDPQNSVFLQAFSDMVLEHMSKRGTDLSGFLAWWDEKGCKQSISTPTDQDAIHIMTIHQSKGLGEKAVIIPLAYWQIDINTNHGEILWLTPERKEFQPSDEQPSIDLPIRLDASLRKTIFKEDFTQERMRAIIDNLNTAYVAFTRAKKAMVIMAPVTKESDKQAPDLSRLLNAFMVNWSCNCDSLKADLDEAFCTTQEAIVEQPEKTGYIQIPKRIDSNARPQIKKSAFCRHDAETARGTTIHNALSVVHYADDYEQPIRQLFASGKEKLEEITIEELLAIVKRLVEQPQAQEWFSRSNRILTEQSIVTHTTHTQRPDRVIITPDKRAIIVDYKSGKTHSKEYHKQVLYYMKLLREMGYKKVEGYLWYIDEMSIETVHGPSVNDQLTLDFG